MKKNSTPTVTPKVIEQFWKICHWTYEVWTTHRMLFDDNRNKTLLRKSKYGPFFTTLNHITHEYALLQLAKLHDPAGQKGNRNLGLEFIRAYGRWEKPKAKQLKGLHLKLNGLYEKIKPARDRILCHNDYQTFLRNRGLGKFPKNADREYFDTLKEFVSAGPLLDARVWIASWMVVWPRCSICSDVTTVTGEAVSA